MDNLWLYACYMPTIALSNNVAFIVYRTVRKRSQLCAFGTFGWIVALIVGSTGLSDSTEIFTLAAVLLVLAIYSFTLPHTPAPERGKPVAMRDLLCADAFAMLKQLMS